MSNEKKSKGFDLSDLSTDKADKGVWLDLEHPIDGGPLLNDKGEQMRVLVGGTDSKAYEKERRAIFDKAQKIQRKKKKPSLAEIEQMENKLIASGVYDWQGLQEDGEPVEYSEAKAVQMLKKYPWLREQVQDFQERRDNFLGN